MTHGIVEKLCNGGYDFELDANINLSQMYSPLIFPIASGITWSAYGGTDANESSIFRQQQIVKEKLIKKQKLYLPKSHNLKKIKNNRIFL